MRELKLKNDIDVCIKTNKNTPRVALCLNLSILEPEKISGQYILMCRLLLKGTEKYNSKELSSILEENAIDLYAEMKYDFIRFRLISLNEDFELALSILSDIINNSTFEEFEKERVKLKGEIMAELDSAKTKVSDLFTKTIYKNHFYGHSYTKILDEIDKLTLEELKQSYKNILEKSVKKLVLVGDVELDNATSLLNNYLGSMPKSVCINTKIETPLPSEKEYAELIKDDAQQAQIIQGWKTSTIGTDDYPVLMLLNVILGASGLSSRLFLELREKKGLAYTVRTSYEARQKSAVFSIYIGTEPSNIETSIKGFEEEIDKIKTIPVSEQELHNAVNNLIGKQQFITETNSQQAILMSYYAISGFPFNYQEHIIDKLRKVTPDDIINCANKYFNDNYVISIIKP